MFRTIFDFVRNSRFVCLSGLAVALVCLGLSGCSSWNLRGAGFKDDSMSATVRQARPPTGNTEFWGFSNKARQIEQDCGVGETSD